MSPTALRNVVPMLTAGMEITLPMKRVGELGESTGPIAHVDVHQIP